VIARFLFRRLFLLPLLGLLAFAAEQPAPTTPPHPLAWDAMAKSADVKPEDGAVEFKFTATNRSDFRVEVFQVRTSCGCTVAELPADPWVLQPGESGTLKAIVDFKGKSGTLAKAIFVNSSSGTQRLDVTVNIPDNGEAQRIINQQRALADRQAVFRGDCATCHAEPAKGKHGAELFASACAICHDSATRATMVTDLSRPREPRDASYWQRWIAEGKDQTLMPAFAAERGGPLSAEQITSLVAYLSQRYPTPAAQP
jgi:mono/diheme cytochrome c family protein